MKNNENPPENMNVMVNWIVHDNFYSEIISKWSKNRNMYLDINNDIIYDIWENPIRLKVKSPSRFTFISSGPNGRFEEGKGDDIQYTYDPHEMKSNSNINN